MALTFPLAIRGGCGALYKCVAQLGRVEVSSQLESAHQTKFYRELSGLLPAYVVPARSTEHTKHNTRQNKM
jgi:hypothetical protein